MTAGGDGILGGGGGGGKRSETGLKLRQRWLKSKKKWLVFLGMILHAVYMLSIFDIYFKTPIVQGMEPVPPRITPRPVALFL